MNPVITITIAIAGLHGTPEIKTQATEQNVSRPPVASYQMQHDPMDARIDERLRERDRVKAAMETDSDIEDISRSMGDDIE